MHRGRKVVFVCNGADAPRTDHSEPRVQRLDYVGQKGCPENVRIGLPQFVQGIRTISPRLCDLLEIAAYVYCADRAVSRGRRAAVEYHAWSRSLSFHIRVRDDAFWQQQSVRSALSDALTFITGDASVRFSFEAGNVLGPSVLFDSTAYVPPSDQEQAVVLFSGGLDSLAGVVDLLQESHKNLLLVSHQSQPGVIRTQRSLVQALQCRFPGRVAHYPFRCNLSGQRAQEESQRTRGFLYTSIACAMMAARGCTELFVHENGVTSLNFPRREDLGNARASRTTHPQTIRRLERLFSLVVEKEVRIGTPFFWKTKTDVMQILKDSTCSDLISSAVSCSKTFQNLGHATHCGGCFQCIDRRFAAYASTAESVDYVGLYDEDVIEKPIGGDVKTATVDYVRQARDFGTWNIDHFHNRLIGELAEVVGYAPDVADEEELVERVWGLCRRHGDQVAVGLRRMRQLHDDPYRPIQTGSLLQLIADREYLMDPTQRLVAALVQLIGPAVGKMFARERPTDEADLNLKVSAMLDSHRLGLEREHPVVGFAGGHVVPDHGRDDQRVVIEAKYIRGSTTVSKASDGMAADLTKYPGHAHVLFVVYDPDRAILDDERFRKDFEKRGRCTVLIAR